MNVPVPPPDLVARLLRDSVLCRIRALLHGRIAAHRLGDSIRSALLRAGVRAPLPSAAEISGGSFTAIYGLGTGSSLQISVCDGAYPKVPLFAEADVVDPPYDSHLFLSISGPRDDAILVQLFADILSGNTSVAAIGIPITGPFLTPADWQDRAGA